MADVTNRGGKEALIAKAVSKEFSRFRLMLLGIIPLLEVWMIDIAPELWIEHAKNLRSGIIPVLTAIFFNQVETEVEDFEIVGIDWSQAHQDAMDWAEGYTTRTLVPDMLQTEKNALAKYIPKYFEEGWTQKQLNDALLKPFGIARAATVGITETTRSAVEGRINWANRIMDQGIELIPFWLTAVDDLVCDICRPMENQPGVYNEQGRPVFHHPATGVLMEPPPYGSHPRCRCDIGHEMA